MYEHSTAQLSNEIIGQCIKEIYLDRIFFGQINTAVSNLNDCIECCQAYKDLYDRVRRSPTPGPLAH